MMKDWTAKKWLGYLALLIVVIFGAKQCGRFGAEQQNARDASTSSVMETNRTSSPVVRGEADIVALTARQPGEGITEAQMDSSFIERFGQWVAERTYANAVKHQVAEGGPAVERMTPESVMVEAGGKRFGVVRLRSQGATPAVTIVGIDGADIVRVTCISRTVQDVPISYGPCDAKIKETFGTSIAAGR